MDQNLIKPEKGSCSLFTSKIYQPKIKCKDGGSYFHKNKKYRQLEIEQNIFQLFHFRTS